MFKKPGRIGHVDHVTRPSFLIFSIHNCTLSFVCETFKIARSYSHQRDGSRQLDQEDRPQHRGYGSLNMLPLALSSEGCRLLVNCNSIENPEVATVQLFVLNPPHHEAVQ